MQTFSAGTENSACFLSIQKAPDDLCSATWVFALANSTFHDFCAVAGKSNRKASDDQSLIRSPGSLAFTKLEITNKAKSFVNHLVGRTGRLRVAKTNEIEIKMLVPMRRRSYYRGISAS